MANNALKKITGEAKRLQKLHPNTPWKNLIKKAGASYRAGSLGKATKSRPTVKRKSSVKRSSKRSAPKNVVVIAGNKLSGVSAGSLKSELKKRLNADIDRAVIKKYRATKKRDKTKIQKVITSKKSELRKLS